MKKLRGWWLKNQKLPKSIKQPRSDDYEVKTPKLWRGDGSEIDRDFAKVNRFRNQAVRLNPDRNSKNFTAETR